MQKYIGTAIKKDVNNPPPQGETPARNVDVRVVVTETGALANIYIANNTSTPIDQNTYKTDVNGNHEFYAANGRYTVRYLLASGTVEYSDIILYDAVDDPSGEGESNTTSNEGDGIGIAMPKDGVNLPFKSFKATGGASITEQSNTITIDVSGVGGDMLKSIYDPTNQNTDAFANKTIYNEQNGTSYTIQASDSGKLVEMLSASANTVTIDTDANQSYIDNMVLLLAQDGTGVTTLNSVSGVTVNGASGDSFAFEFSKQFQVISIERKSINNWIVRGV